jgi:hypothetical protein
MNIHLIRSKDVSDDLYDALEALLSDKGPLAFHFTEDYAADFEEQEVLSWEELYSVCSSYRFSKNIPESELIILLTDKPNEGGWFSAMDFNNPTHGFVHSGGWEAYLDAEPQHPVAYQVVALVLHKFIVYDDGSDALESRTHDDPIGCVSDMCNDKRQVILQTRMADICTDCLHILAEKVEIKLITQAFRLIDSIRSKMLFTTRFLERVPLSRLSVSRAGRIRLKGLMDMELELSPQEKTIYIFLLLQGRPIGISELDNYYDELLGIYKIITEADMDNSDAVREVQHITISNLINATTDVAYQVISKIRKKIKTIIGPEFARHYTISDDSNKRKQITLDPQLIDVEREWWEAEMKRVIKIR